ncbi:MBL fold metallo-hydrolase [Arthrobacter sp. Sa2CUA1]|uniref:MBL fold metallo-hydrolase n=2 Tax=Arthrobacter gallicola TaxID=2762225 RepID=A0ABR8UVT8_9MICC|nr:MBL fold metallo-hydrolase [Arthrobacter gallicola]
MRAHDMNKPLPEPAAGMSVITLGTAAGPAIRGPHPGMATAVVVDGSFYLVDFGLGITRAANSAGLRGENLRACFITHLHSDHVAELPGYFLWNWGRPVNGITTPATVFGPGTDPQGIPGENGGTAAMVEHLLEAFSYDINIRVHDEGRPDLRELVLAADIELPAAVAGTAHGNHTPAMEPFLVYEDELVRVSAILVEHPPVFPAFGFRIESRYGSVVISGDTTECANMVALATGADLLIHEAVNLDYFAALDMAPEFLNHQRISHTTAPGVGRVAAQAGVPHVVLSHLAGLASDDEWTAGVRTGFDGRITVAAPGNRFDVAGAALAEAL